MTKKIILILAILNTILCIPKEQDNSIRSNSLEKKINSLEKEVEGLKANENLVEEYKDLNNLYSIGFGILIALFGFVFPTVIYFAQIKPSIDVTKESKLLLRKIDNDFEKSFKKHLLEYRNRAIDQAISRLANLDGNALPTNFTTIDGYRDEKFTNSQIKNLIALLEKPEIDEGIKEFIASTLAFQKNKIVEDYFVTIMERPNYIRLYGVEYFSRFDKKKHIGKVVKLILDGHALSDIHKYVKNGSKSFMHNLVNNEDLIENISDDLMRSFYEYVQNYKDNQKELETIKKSNLWTKIVARSKENFA